jgi:hypothetical protein
MITALASFAFAAALFAIGTWGRRNAADLVPASFSTEGRAKQERSLRRGAISITALGGMFAVLGVMTVLATLIDSGTTR